MGFTMPHVTVLIAIAAVGVALLFQIIGLATEGWIKTSISSWGLWTGKEYAADWVKACRAFGVLGVLAMAGSLLCALLSCVLSDLKILTLLAPLAALGGAFCSMIEFAVFAGEYSAASDYFDYSFALTIVACLLCVGAAVLFFLGRNKAPA